MRGGVSFLPLRLRHPDGVFPTCVGVFLEKALKGATPKRLPHVRGGVSLAYLIFDVCQQSSPRAWGCFCAQGLSSAPKRVFPTCVGVFLFLSEVRP